jgi:hypothetical protein
MYELAIGIMTGEIHIRKKLKIKLRKVGALKNLTNLQAHLKAHICDCLEQCVIKNF